MRRSGELTWSRRVEALEVPRRKLPREALILATDEESRDDVAYEFLSLQDLERSPVWLGITRDGKV